MTSLRETVESLVADDDLKRAAFTLLQGLEADDPPEADDARVLLAEVTRAETNHRRGLVDDDDYARTRRQLAFRLLEVVETAFPSQNDAGSGVAAGSPPSPAPTSELLGDQVSTAATARADAAPSSAPPHVFLSYSHLDAVVAGRLQEALEGLGLEVTADRSAMRPGEGIRDFIGRAIASTDATVCLISTSSLLSAWAGLEIVEAFHANAHGGGRRFFACYLDDDFFEPRFRLDCTREIDGRIAEIEALMPEYAEQRIDTEDLNAEKTRLYALRHNLGPILNRLKESLLLDARDDVLDESARRIAEDLQVSG